MRYKSRLIQSFRAAFAGWGIVFRREPNFRVQITAAVAAVLLALAIQLSRAELVAILIVSGLVLTLECCNSAVERMIDLLEPRMHPQVKVIKDIMAGAVLLASVLAVLVALLVFFPHFLTLLK